MCLFILAAAFFFAGPILLHQLIGPRLRGLASTLVYPCAFVVTQYLYSRLSPSGTYGSIAYTQTFGPLLQVVALAGIWGLLFFLGWSASAAERWSQREPVERGAIVYGVVVESTPASFVLTPLGQSLRKDTPNSEWAAVVFWADLLADSWSYLTECIRSGDSAMLVRPQGVASRWSKDPGASAIFRAVMGTAPTEDYMPIVRALHFSNYQTVADLGGGGGALIAAVLEAFPNLHGMLVDRQESIDEAVSRFEREGLVERCKLVASDLCKEVPSGAEVYMMKHVVVRQISILVQNYVTSPLHTNR
jgi:hypothetical protein